LTYIHTTGRYTSGINLFEKLRSRDPEVSSLLAQVLFSGDEEVKAVQLLHDAVIEIPMDYSLLTAQATFLQNKGNLEWALPLAERAVTAAPSEFGTWAKLAEIYVGLERWDLALLTLNACPMFTYQDKDAPRMPEPAKVMLPLLPDTALDEIDESMDNHDTDMVNPNLRKLGAGNYKGTFQKAYSLLTDITAKIGWDSLLKIRSQVFVMEEEYRSEKTPKTAEGGASIESSSTTAIRVPSPKVNGDDTASFKSTDDATLADTQHYNNQTGDSLEKPEHTVASEEVKSGSEDPDPTHMAYTHFQHKRLCERWLDNLFMVLYEDLRIYTIWRTEIAQAKAANNPQSPSPNAQVNAAFSKSPEEWEILGDLAARLHRHPEAIEAYQACLRVRFSPKAMRAVTRMWEKEKKAESVLQGMIRLIAWQYRWYSEVRRIFIIGMSSLLISLLQFSPDLLRAVRNLIEEEGAMKVRSIVQATSLPQSVLDLTHHYVELCATFRSSGSDA
jgi:tetratricopeptide (TPR) repeat protein